VIAEEEVAQEPEARISEGRAGPRQD